LCQFLAGYLAYSSTLNIEAIISFETLVNFAAQHGVTTQMTVILMFNVVRFWEQEESLEAQHR
jgi:hypothetical protein